jgi:hypothetical protein
MSASVIITVGGFSSSSAFTVSTACRIPSVLISYQLPFRLVAVQSSRR